MKIAFVSDAIYPYNKGGKEKRIYEISTRLAKKGYDMHIYTMQWWKGEKVKKENGMTLHAISKLYPLYSGKRRSIKEAFFFSIACLRLLNEDFDIIDVDHMPHLILFPLKLVSVLKKKRLVVTWNEVWGRKYWKEYLGILGELAYIIELLSVKTPDIIISVSAHTTKKLQQELKSDKKIFTIPNGINWEEIQKTQPSKEKSDLIYAGRLLSHKHIDILIESVAILKKHNPTIKAIIIGEGPEKEFLKQLVEKKKLEKNIIFFDFLQSYIDVYAFMKSSNVFILPSTREGFGIVAIEANACGIPFITTNHKDNATKDLITQEENGFVVNLDRNEIVAKIVRCMNINNADVIRKSSIQYDWDTIVNKVKEIYFYA